MKYRRRPIDSSRRVDGCIRKDPLPSSTCVILSPNVRNAQASRNCDLIGGHGTQRLPRQVWMRAHAGFGWWYPPKVTSALGNPTKATLSITDLAAVVGRDHVIVDPDVRRGYETDFMGRRLGFCSAVVIPGSTDEVSQVVRTCARIGVPIVPQGGNTGLVGGGVPRNGEVLLSTARLDSVADVDTAAAQLAVGAGVTLARAREVARPHGLDIGADLASRQSATIGGMVATNAGGVRVLRYGHMRSQVAGLEVVLSDGRVITRMAGLRKDTAGYDLTGLFCGSEGTLGIVTSVLLSLVPTSTARVSALLGVESLASALAVLSKLKERGVELDSAEVMFAQGVRWVADLFGVSPPLTPIPPCLLLVEVSSSVGRSVDDLMDYLASALDQCSEVQSSAVASDESARLALWSARERHPEVVSRLGTPHKLDVSLPLALLPRFESEVRQVLAKCECEYVLYGHIGDGNLHVNVATQTSEHEEIERPVFELVRQFGGSISAEHGIGTDKVRWLEFTRSANEIFALRRIKEALDPTSMFNPGVLFPTT